MPDLSHREKELRASFEKDKETFKPGERVEVPLRMSPLYQARASALADILPPLIDQGLEPKARAVEDKMQLVLDRWVLPFSKVTTGLVYPGDEVNWWREHEVTQEMKFLQGLVNLNIEGMRDDFAALEVKLNQLVADLTKKWGTMSEESKRIEGLEAEACRKMSDIMKKGLSRGTDAYLRYSDSLKRLLDYFMKVPDLANDAVVYLLIEAGLPEQLAKLVPKISLLGKDYFAKGKELGVSAKDLAAYNPELCRDPGMAVSETIQKAIGPEFEGFITAVNALYKDLTNLSSEYRAQLDDLQRLVPNQGAILVSVSQTRRDVDDFLKVNGLDRAREMYEKAEASLDRWANDLPTDGQKADAREWAEAVKEAFKARYERMANTFGMFVQANQGRFIGSVSKSVENELIFTDVWVDRTQGLMDIGMDDRLREWRKGTIEVNDIFSTASSQVFERIRYLPQDMQDSVTKALNNYWSKMRDRLKTESTQAADTFAQLEAVVNDESVKRDLNRAPLRERLTA
ncbi:MAG: hypothetical protein U1G08_15100 [Verrucomicrobiota bacterium]